HLGEYLDPHRAAGEPELVEHDPRRALERAPIVRVPCELILDAPARDQQVNALFAVLDERLDRQRHRGRDRVAAVDDRVLAEEDDLAVADAHRGLALFPALTPRGVALLALLVADLRDDLLRLPDLDRAALNQPLEHLVEDF